MLFMTKCSMNRFIKKLESVQHNVALAMTVVIREINMKKLYQELGLESLQNRRKLQSLYSFYKILYKNFLFLKSC